MGIGIFIIIRDTEYFLYVLLVFGIYSGNVWSCFFVLKKTVFVVFLGCIELSPLCNLDINPYHMYTLEVISHFKDACRPAVHLGLRKT